jgi:hypothetical protein
MQRFVDLGIPALMLTCSNITHCCEYVNGCHLRARGLNETTTRATSCVRAHHKLICILDAQRELSLLFENSCRWLVQFMCESVCLGILQRRAYTKCSLFSIPLRASLAFHSLLLRLLRNGETRK